jgi:hypothetical protein
MMKSLFACSVIATCASPQAPPHAPPQPRQMTGEMEHAMMNCPSAVEGAQTRVVQTPGGVDVIVTSAEAAAQVEIRALADYHARMDRFTDWPSHSGFHGGPGTSGHCPIIHDRTRITLSPVPDGVTLHVRAMSPDHVASVQEQTAQRLATLPGWLPRPAH